jgi:transposase
MWNLPKGEEFLPCVGSDALKVVYETEKQAKPKLRLLCAVHRKEGKSIDNISFSTNMKRRTVHAILQRFVERGLEAKDSAGKSGRPPKLKGRQRKDLMLILERGPPYNKSGLWTTKEVREIIRKKFGVEYAHPYVWELLKAAGFSIQRPRPQHPNAPGKQEVAHFKKRLKCWQPDSPKKGLY